jgi:hypothetical protein
MESVLKKVLKEDKLEELLVANWTHFVDSGRLMAYVLQNVQANVNNLAVIPTSEIKPKGVQITLSRFHWTMSGFLIWAEFTVPVRLDMVAVGTMELHLSSNGSLTHTQTLGNLYSKS